MPGVTGLGYSGGGGNSGWGGGDGGRGGGGGGGGGGGEWERGANLKEYYSKRDEQEAQAVRHFLFTPSCQRESSLTLEPPPGSN